MKKSTSVQMTIIKPKAIIGHRTVLTNEERNPYMYRKVKKESPRLGNWKDKANGINGKNKVKGQPQI